MSAEFDQETSLEAGFGVANCWVEPLAGIIRCGDQRLHVEPKVMDVLLCLARAPGAIVTRDALMQAVWGGVVVTDDVLTRCISELRTILGDTDRERRFIRTIPKRGYSLIAPVHTDRAAFESPDARSATTAPHPPPPDSVDVSSAPVAGGVERSTRGVLKTAGLLAVGLVALIVYFGYLDDREPQITVVDDERTASVATAQQDGAIAARPGAAGDGPPQSLAVLPFVNLSGDAEHDFFSDGLSEDVRNGMLTSTQLRVSARTSSRAFKGITIDVREIGRQLEVDALLEGTVRINDGHVRVTAQLTDVSDGYPLWAGSYERDLGEHIRTQVDIARAIVADLAPSVTTNGGLPAGTPTNIAAHEYYLLGRHQWHLRNPAALDLATTYFEDALELDPNYALAYSGLSDAHLFQISYGGEPEPEMLEIAGGYARRAIELGPELAETHASQGLLHEYLGEPEKARDAYRIAVEIKPQYSMAQMWLGNTLMDLQDIEGAFRHMSIARDLDPLHPQVQFNYANALMLQGRYEDAKASLDHFLRFRQNEMLTQQKLAVDFYTGRYDLMLQSAVGYTHGGEFAPYRNRTVIESLIYLRRFAEAEQMILDNAAGIDELTTYLLRGELAVARRDAASLGEVADAMRATSPATKKAKNAACIGLWADAFDAAAAFIAADYVSSAARFERLMQTGFESTCIVELPEGAPTVMTYLAASRLKLDPDDAEARRLLDAAAGRVAALRERGYDTPSLGIVDAAIRWYTGDREVAEQTLERMNARGWRIYGLMRFSPLYDDLLAQAGEGVPAALREAFEPVERDCAGIGLAKLGL